jgi:hypothetical protein
MTVRVTVYELCSQDETEFSANECSARLLIQFMLVGCIELPNQGCVSMELAARAWIETVGHFRKLDLLRWGALERIADEQVSPTTVLAGMRPAPAGFQAADAYFYDNMVESWLIVVGDHGCPCEPELSSWRPSRMFVTNAYRPDGLGGSSILSALRNPPLN